MDSFFGLDTPHVDADMELLTTTHDDVELSILCDILKGEGIPFLRNDRGSGGAMRIISGYSTCGTDILVPRDLLGQANEVLEAYRTAEPVEEAVGERDEEDFENFTGFGDDAEGKA